jgi:hypothetical protein
MQGSAKAMPGVGALHVQLSMIGLQAVGRAGLEPGLSTHPWPLPGKTGFAF